MCLGTSDCSSGFSTTCEIVRVNILKVEQDIFDHAVEPVTAIVWLLKLNFNVRFIKTILHISMKSGKAGPHLRWGPGRDKIALRRCGEISSW